MTVSPPAIFPVTTARPVAMDGVASRAGTTSAASVTASLWPLETSSGLSSTTSSVYTIPTSSPAAPFANYGEANNHPRWYLAYTATLLCLGVWHCYGWLSCDVGCEVGDIGW